MKLQKILFSTFMGIAIFLPLNVFAAWHFANGEGNNTDDAVNNAIYNLVLQNGGDPSKVQTFRGGQLQRTSDNPFDNGAIKRIVVLERQSSLNGTTRVKIKAFINDKQMQYHCKNSKIKKSLLPICFRYADSAAFQGAVGIENLNKELDKQFIENLRKTAIFSLKTPLKLNTINDNGKNVGEATRIENLNALAHRNGCQYVAIGTINSLSKSKVGNNVVMNMMFMPTRSINFDIDIYDAVNQEIVFHQNYAGETDWPFDSDEFIDVRSDRFKGSDFGRRVYELTSDAVKDLASHFGCADISARVVDVEGENIIINIGRENGVTKDMLFTLEQVATVHNVNGYEYEMQDQGLGSYKVVAIYPRTTKLKPVDLQNSTINVSIDDIVKLQ